MYEENQNFVPESFMMLYVKSGHYKPSLPRSELTQRYELCEDMANLLMDTVSTQQFQLGIAEEDALEKCWQGLIAEPSMVNPEEAFWVVCRLAELLSWPIPKTHWN
jgi:hypothetical protein